MAMSVGCVSMIRLCRHATNKPLKIQLQKKGINPYLESQTRSLIDFHDFHITSGGMRINRKVHVCINKVI